MNNWVLGLASRIVYDEMIKDGPNIFSGFYTGDKSSSDFMYGVSTVVEYIADHAQMQDDFNDRFVLNMISCEEKFDREKNFKKNFRRN